MFYKPSKYKIISGQPTNLALCTCWFDPFSANNHLDSIKSRFSVTGTLYSKEGVSIIIRNLALNPNIRYLFIWSNTPLSNTPFGKAGRDLLFRIWENPSDNSDIHKEIDIEVLKNVVKNVQLVHLDNIPFGELLSFDTTLYSNHEPYMEPVDFPEPHRDESVPFPSEKVGWSVRGHTIYDSWLRAVDRVMRYGHVKDTEYGNKQRELHNVTWVVFSEDPQDVFVPDIEISILDLIGMSPESLAKYKESLLDPVVPEGTSYTYGGRLRNYEDSFDQVDFLIQKLKEQKITRRAVSTTLMPKSDSQHKSPPCLVYVQVLTDDSNTLDMFAVFRSHDMSKAGIPNAYGLRNLQKHICNETGLELGMLSINSISAHVYEEDWDNIVKLLKCQHWEGTKTRFNEHTDADPRGNVRIYVNDGKLTLELLDNVGLVLYTDSDVLYRPIILRLAKLDLLSRDDHYADVCIELLKATVCMQLGVPYLQDKPVTVAGLNLV